MDDLLGMDFTATSNQQKATGHKAAANYGRTTFDYLAASSSTSTQQQPNRSPSPLAPSISPSPTRSASPAVHNKPSSSPANAGGDAFAALFGAPTGSAAGAGAGVGARPGTTLSMAERLAQESAARIGGLGSMNPSSASWAGLNPSRPASAASGGRGSPAVPLQPTRQASTSSAASSARATVATSATSTPDPWDFDLLAPTMTGSRPSSITSHSDDPFGLGFGGGPTAPAARLGVPSGGGKTLRRQRSFMDSDGDDDFATNEDGLLGGSGLPTHHTQDEDDILGALSQPVSQLRVASPPVTSRSSTPASRASPAPRSTASPPPHILGQIVEMGFSVPQASSALQATAGPNGQWNVEAALEALVDTQQAEAHTSRRREAEEWGAAVEAEGGSRRPTSDRSRQERPRERVPEPDALQPRPTGRRAREAAAREAAARQANGGADASGSGLVPAAAADQAAELFAQAQKQASKIGFSMFKSASAYVAQGKAAVEKALAEQAEAKARAGGQAASGRPKWMTEDFADEDGAVPVPRARQRPAEAQPPVPAREPPPSLFKDSDDEDQVLPQRPFASTMTPNQPAAARPPPPRQSPAVDPAPAAYKSPWRTAKAAPSPAPSLPLASAAQPRRPTPTPSPKPARPSRQSVPVSPAALASATAHKNKGNDLFKLGRFGDAAAAYSLALADLPAGSLARVPLLSNRAGARLKVGEEKVAIEDCSEVIRLILPEGLPGPDGRIDVDGLEQERLPVEAQEVKLVEMLGKALGRRAKAREAEEQWSKAGEDWELVRRSGEALTRGAGGAKLVSEGAARCRKATAAPPARATSTPASASASAPPPRPKAVPFRPAVTSSGAAVAAHRANEASAEAEDELRFKMKDGVEARIAGWKGGKEANLRALIASLDTVLWPEVGWVKVGMGELLTEGQVKVRYMKAIAKVHPDKLNVSNTTVEQRMVAGLVFAALNEAWTAQKA